MGSSGAKVTAASKLPMRLEMQCSVKRTQMRRHQGETWQEETFFKDGPVAIIEGTAYPVGQVPDGMRPRPRVVVGYALTPNVSKDLYDAWAKENADSALIRNKLIFAYEQRDAVEGAAKDLKDIDSGLGPLIPDTDRRWPRKIANSRQARVPPESEPDYSE
jgi:hypothetical protein